MSQTGLSVFDSTIQTTNVWLNDILVRLGWQDHHRAFVENDFQFEPQILDHIQNHEVVRFAARHDDVPD